MDPHIHSKGSFLSHGTLTKWSRCAINLSITDEAHCAAGQEAHIPNDPPQIPTSTQFAAHWMKMAALGQNTCNSSNSLRTKTHSKVCQSSDDLY